MGFDELVSATVELGKLEDGWHGESSIAPSHSTIARTIRLLIMLRQFGNELPQRVVPAIDGTVRLEFETSTLWISHGLGNQPLRPAIKYAPQRGRVFGG